MRWQARMRRRRMRWQARRSESRWQAFVYIHFVAIPLPLHPPPPLSPPPAARELRGWYVTRTTPRHPPPTQPTPPSPPSPPASILVWWAYSEALYEYIYIYI
jgi:hypothetical protein